MESGDIVPREFYERSTVDVARDLLGLELTYYHSDGRRMRGRIVETEAYMGPDDRASHASRGRTRRTEVMFGPAGHAYVYLIYGFYHCLNIVTERDGFPAAILIRGVEPLEGIVGAANGPGKLCRALGIDRTLNGCDVTSPPLFLRWSDEPMTEKIVDAGPRIGVGYAGEWAERPWRFWLRGNAHVSRPPRRTIGLGESIVSHPGRGSHA